MDAQTGYEFMSGNSVTEPVNPDAVYEISAIPSREQIIRSAWQDSWKQLLRLQDLAVNIQDSAKDLQNKINEYEPTYRAIQVNPVLSTNIQQYCLWLAKVAPLVWVMQQSIPEDNQDLSEKVKTCVEFLAFSWGQLHDEVTRPYIGATNRWMLRCVVACCLGAFGLVVDVVISPFLSHAKAEAQSNGLVTGLVIASIFTMSSLLAAYFSKRQSNKYHQLQAQFVLPQKALAIGTYESERMHENFKVDVEPL